VVPAGALPVPVSDGLNRPVLGLNRRILSGSSRPTLRQYRSKPAAQLLPICAGGYINALCVKANGQEAACTRDLQRWLLTLPPSRPGAVCAPPTRTGPWPSRGSARRRHRATVEKISGRRSCGRRAHGHCRREVRAPSHTDDPSCEIVMFGISGGRSPTRPFRDASRIPSTRL
jgi:hypothetical protein